VNEPKLSELLLIDAKVFDPNSFDYPQMFNDYADQALALEKERDTLAAALAMAAPETTHDVDYWKQAAKDWLDRYYYPVINGGAK